MPNPPLYTCGDIAHELGYDNSSIFRALKRHDVPPDETTVGGMKLYRKSTVEALKPKLQPSRRR